nr:MAG TPA: hypothetical protein [Caudoviricetes sp.]
MVCSKCLLTFIEKVKHSFYKGSCFTFSIR